MRPTPGTECRVRAISCWVKLLVHWGVSSLGSLSDPYSLNPDLGPDLNSGF